MKKLIVFISVCCLLYSCYDGNHAAIPKDKIPELKNNDTVYFQDSVNNNKIDTFRIDIGEIWHYTTEEDYLQYIQIYYNKLNRQTTFFSIYISPSGGGSMFVVDNYYRPGRMGFDHKNGSQILRIQKVGSQIPPTSSNIYTSNEYIREDGVGWVLYRNGAFDDMEIPSPQYHQNNYTPNYNYTPQDAIRSQYPLGDSPQPIYFNH